MKDERKTIGKWNEIQIPQKEKKKRVFFLDKKYISWWICLYNRYLIKFNWVFECSLQLNIYKLYIYQFNSIDVVI